MLARFAVLALTTAVLGGCSNMVFSEAPLFKADPAAGPIYRAGLWAAPDKGCRFNSARPLAKWPKCAHGELFDAKGPVDDSDDWRPELVAGDPLLLQIGETAKAGDSAAQDDWMRYSYHAVAVTRRDAAGRAIDVMTWPVECGPRAKPHRLPGLDHKTTAIRHPYPGLTMRGENCLATDPAVVRRAAVASGKFHASRAHWVRDGR